MNASRPDLALVQGAISALGKHQHGIGRLMDDLYSERFALGAK